MHAAGERSGKKAGGAAFFHAGNGKRNRESLESRYEPGQVAEREEAEEQEPVHDAGERELLFPHRPLSSDFLGLLFYEGRTGLFSAFPRKELQETISSGVLLQETTEDMKK